MDESSEHVPQPGGPRSSVATPLSHDAGQPSASAIEQMKDFPSAGLIQAEPLARVSLEVNVAVLLARINVAMQMRHYRKAEGLLERAVYLATALDHGLLQDRCSFWTGLLSAERKNKQHAAEAFIEAIPIIGQACPESSALARAIRAHMGWIEESIRAKVENEEEATSSIEELQSMLPGTDDSEACDETTTFSPAEADRGLLDRERAPPSRMLCDKCGAKISESRSSSDKSSSPKSPLSRRLQREFSIPLATVTEESEHIQKSKSESESDSGPPTPRSSDHIMLLIDELKDYKPRRPILRQDETAPAHEDKRKPSFEFPEGWKAFDNSDHVRRSLEGASVAGPEASPPSPSHVARVREDTILSDTLTPEMLDQRIHAQSGRRTSIGAAPNKPTLTPIKTADRQENELPRSYTRRCGTDPAVSSPLREEFILDDQEDAATRVNSTTVSPKSIT